MIALLQLLPALFGLFKARGVQDVEGSLLDKIEAAFTAFVGEDTDAQKLITQSIADARDADAKTFDPSIHIINAMRSSVRPVCTFMAMSWYVYARVKGVALTPEDYAIIGGIIAFWFGFRPFEKTKT